jgi:hypothetical protein
MKPQILRLPVFIFFVSLSWSNATQAESVECGNINGEVAKAICAKSELVALAALIDALGSVVGLEVKYDANSIGEDFGMSRGVRRLLSTLTFAEAHNLDGLSPDLPWDFTFDVQNKVLILRAENAYLQDGLAVYPPTATSSSTPIYTDFPETYDALRYTYRMADDILEVTATARPADTTDKFRYQDGCWRLIGTDTVWAGYMIEYNDDLAAVSINHLTGREILDFKEKTGVLRTFDPAVRCLGDDFYAYQIEYHQSGDQ